MGIEANEHMGANGKTHPHRGEFGSGIKFGLVVFTRDMQNRFRQLAGAAAAKFIERVVPV